MKINDLLGEGWNKRDSYQRDYDSSVSGFGRPHDHRGLEQELGHETNNYAVSINGKTWKVFATKSHAESVARKIQMKDPSKKVSVHETGASVNEEATAGSTMAANMGTVDAPQLSPGKARGKKSYLGSPSTGSGTKAPPQPKVVQPKTSAGTAKNALDMKANVFGQAKE